MYGTAPKRLPHLLPWTWLFHLRRWGELRHTAEQGFRKTSTFWVQCDACRVGWNSQHAKFHKALDRCTMVHSTTIQKKSSTSWRVKITSFLFLKKKTVEISWRVGCVSVAFCLASTACGRRALALDLGVQGNATWKPKDARSQGAEQSRYRFWQVG